MWHNTSSKSSAPQQRNQASAGSALLHKGKATSTKVKAEEWETLRGWRGDYDACDIESIDIDSWSKKHSQRGKDTPKEEWQTFLCWNTTRCSTIPDFDDFVSDSLSANIKPAPLKPDPKSAPQTAGSSSPVKHVKSSKAPKTKSIPKVFVCKTENNESDEVKGSGKERTTFDVDSEECGSSVVGCAISTAYTESECTQALDRDDSKSNASAGPCSNADGDSKVPSGASVRLSGVSVRLSGVVRSAPVSRPPDRTEKKSRKIASAKSAPDSETRTTQMRRAAIRESATKSSLDLKRLTLDISAPPSPPNARLSYSNSPHGAGEETGNLTRSPVHRDSTEPQVHLSARGTPDDTHHSATDKSAVLRLVAERLKRSNASSKLGFDLPNAGNMSVGDLLASSRRIVHRRGPVGDSERDPNVYAALIGGINLTTEHDDTLNPWSQGGSNAPMDSAIKSAGASDPHHGPQGVTQNGSRTKDTTISILPSLSGTRSPSSGLSLIKSSPVDSTSSGDSVMIRQASPGGSTESSEDASLMKTDNGAKRRVEYVEPKSTKTKHRGPPAFRPLAGKTSLQRAVETAHKKIHGHHYYLFTHSSNSNHQGLPRYTSSGQPSSGHQERAGSGKSHRSERSMNSAYVWKEHLESQIKQQRSTTAPYLPNTGATSHQQTNPRTNQSSSVPLTLMPSRLK